MKLDSQTSAGKPPNKISETLSAASPKFPKLNWFWTSRRDPEDWLTLSSRMRNLWRKLSRTLNAPIWSAPSRSSALSLLLKSNKNVPTKPRLRTSPRDNPDANLAVVARPPVLVSVSTVPAIMTITLFTSVT